MVKLDKFCVYTPLKVLGISFAISLIVLLVASIIFSEDYTQEELRARHGEGNFAGLLIFAVCVICSSFCSICSYMICLNLYRTVRDNLALSFITFYSPVVLYPVLLFMITETDIWDLEMIFLSVILPSIVFLIPQTYYFLKFRKRLKYGEITDDFYYESYD